MSHNRKLEMVGLADRDRLILIKEGFGQKVIQRRMIDLTRQPLSRDVG